MSRDNDCVERPHMHVGQCMRAGYASGRADALEQIAALRAKIEEAPRVGDEVTVAGLVRTVTSLAPEGHYRITVDVDLNG